MKQGILLCTLVLGLGLSAFAQGSRVPAFNQYPARVERVRTKAINFKRNPEARRYRTVLTEALRDGINFAGHYVVATWGCGTACQIGAIIDARTGDVFWPKELAGIYTIFDEPIRHRANSRLIVISTVPATKADNREDSYYEWKNNRLRLIRSVVLKTN